MACTILREVCKRAGERKMFPAFDLVQVFSRVWLPNHPFDAGVRIRPNERLSGFEYESSGGQSSAREPRRWPGALGEEIQDGSITWTAHEISNASLIYRIASVSYDVPAGITLHEQPYVDAPGAQQVRIELSGGAAGKVYDVVAAVQATAVGQSAPLYELVWRVTVE